MFHRVNSPVPDFPLALAAPAGLWLLIRQLLIAATGNYTFFNLVDHRFA
jgi:hypothetical protein